MARPNCGYWKLLYHTAVYNCTNGTTELCYWQTTVSYCSLQLYTWHDRTVLLATTVSYCSIQLYKWRDRTIVTGSYYILLQSTAVQMARPNCGYWQLLYRTAVYNCTNGTTELCYWQLLYHSAVYSCTKGATELWLLATTVSYYSLQLYKWHDRTVITSNYCIVLQSTAVQMALPSCGYWQLLYLTAVYICTNGTTELWLLATTVSYCTLQLYKWHDRTVVTGNYCTVLQSTAVQMTRPNCGYWQLLSRTAVYSCTNGATKLLLLATTVSYCNLQLYKWHDRTVVTGNYCTILQSTAVQMARLKCGYWQLLYHTAIYSCTNGTTELWLLATTVSYCSPQL